MLYDVDFDAKGPGDAEDRGSNLGLLTKNGLVLGYKSRVELVLEWKAWILTEPRNPSSTAETMYFIGRSRHLIDLFS